MNMRMFERFLDIPLKEFSISLDVDLVHLAIEEMVLTAKVWQKYVNITAYNNS